MFKIIFIATLFILSVYSTATFTADGCNGLAPTGLKDACKNTATAAGGSKACCLVSNPVLKIPFKQSETTANKNRAKANDVAVVAATKGSQIDTSKFYACFAAGGQFRFKGATDVEHEKEGFAKAETLCGAAGNAVVAEGSQDGGKNIDITTCSGTTCAGSETLADETAKCVTATSDNTRNGLCLVTKADTCACGTSGMPTDACASLASADVKTKCTATSDGGSPAKKCCLATFDALPTTIKSGGKEAVATPAKGGKVDGTKYYACYKSSSGKMRFKTGSSATNADKSAWVSADSFCATAKVGKAQGGTTGVSFTHTVDTAITGSSSKGLGGTAKTCVCGASNIFTISFMLLAILATLWK